MFFDRYVEGGINPLDYLVVTESSPINACDKCECVRCEEYSGKEGRTLLELEEGEIIKENHLSTPISDVHSMHSHIRGHLLLGV